MKSISTYLALFLLPIFAAYAQAQVDLPTDFEGAAESYVFTDFDGGAAAIIANPGPAASWPWLRWTSPQVRYLR
jgi:hypothetical protein